MVLHFRFKVRETVWGRSRKNNELLRKSSYSEDVQVVPALTLRKGKWNVDVGGLEPVLVQPFLCQLVS